MASGPNSTGDADYDTSLRQLMQTCLPPVLAEIVDRRPVDPISYLAQALYKFREEESKTSMTMSGAAGSTDRLTYGQSSHRAGNTTHQSGHTSHRPGHTVTVSDSTTHRTSNRHDTTVRAVPRPSPSQPAAVRLIEEDLGDEGLGEIREELGDITSNMVHTSEDTLLKSIGDIFDDSDIT